MKNKLAMPRLSKKASFFQAELHAFKKLAKESKKKTSPSASTSASEELKPLPDILNFVLQQNRSNDASATDELGLPDVPPNSVEAVERSVSVYDDDFLSAETEDIELF